MSLRVSEYQYYSTLITQLRQTTINSSQIYFTVAPDCNQRETFLSLYRFFETVASMDKQGKKYLEEALRDKTPHERFNSALARVVGEKVQGKKGYKLYLELMDEVRSLASEENISREKAVETILGKV